jgi:hypothetical protein
VHALASLLLLPDRAAARGRELLRATLPSSTVRPGDVNEPSRSSAALRILDGDGNEILLDADDTAALLVVTGVLDAATISACPSCRSRVLACLALVDALEAAPPHPRTDELVEFADDAPTSHCYVEDLATACRHRNWLDPGRLEWADVVARAAHPAPRPRH